MGIPGRRRSIRASLAFLGMAAAAASALAVLGSSAAFATAPEIAVTAGTSFTADEGSSSGTQVVANFTDSGNLPILVAAASVSPCDQAAQARYTATIDWGDGSVAGPGLVSCTDVAGTWQVSGDHTYNDSGTFNIDVAVTDSADQPAVTGSGTSTATATINDRAITSGAASNISKVEGAKAMISATFADANQAFSSNEGVDPGLTATIDWGDGSTVTSDLKISWNDSSDANVVVTGSHVYDANQPATKAYNAKVTLKDNGVDAQASDTFKATVSDAALTAGAAKSFVATGAQSSSPVVASFTDAAGSQAKAADYTATIKWGDGTSSAGTAAQTAAGAFDVSGTHTYSTAGTKSLTITVTDEEGQTLSMSATATVPALPTTGQPKTPLAPSLPLLALIVMALGLLAIAGGVGQTLVRMARR